MKNHLTRLIKSTAIYGTGQILTRALSFFLLPIFTAYLTPADYGTYGILAMMSFLLVPIFSLGFGTSIGVCYFNDSKQETREATIWTAFSLLLISTALLCVGGIIFDNEISWLAFQTDKYTYFVIITIFSTAFGVLVTPFMLYLQFEEMAVRFVVISSVATIVSIAINVGMVVGLDRGITGLVEGSFIGQIINFFLFSFYPIKLTRFRIDRAISKDLLRNGLPMVPSFASLFLLQHGNRYVLQWYHGLTEVGIYTIGYTIGMFMNVLVNAFQSAWVPFFLSFSDKKEEASRLFGRLTTYYLLGFGFLSLLSYIYARALVLVMTTAPFYESYKAIGLVATSQFLIGIFSLLLPPIYFAKDVKVISIVQSISAALSIGFAIFLIPHAGMIGAAFTIMLGMLLMCITQYLWIVAKKDRYIQISYEGKRILLLGILYAIIALLMLVERNLSITAEIIFSLANTIFLGILIYAALRKTEKEELNIFFRSMLFQKSK